MREERRVDLIFPRSGQVLTICVPDTLIDWVAKRNLQILLSLYGEGALRAYRHRVRKFQVCPS